MNPAPPVTRIRIAPKASGGRGGEPWPNGRDRCPTPNFVKGRRVPKEQQSLHSARTGLLGTWPLAAERAKMLDMRTLGAVAAIAGAAVATASPTTTVTSAGRIGPLRIDVSTRAAIVAAAGRPDAERVGTLNGSRRYRALGYECTAAKSDLRVRWPLLARGPYCRTVFFLDPRSGRLGDFFTTSSRYREAHGVRIGMPTATAERLLHRRVYIGCEENIYLPPLTIAFTGGHAGQHLHLIGGHVYAFAMNGRHHDVGVFDCL
jgi:hypothetical protein